MGRTDFFYHAPMCWRRTEFSIVYVLHFIIREFDDRGFVASFIDANHSDPDFPVVKKELYFYVRIGIFVV